jgi:hypothetical protein
MALVESQSYRLEWSRTAWLEGANPGRPGLLDRFLITTVRFCAGLLARVLL